MKVKGMVSRLFSYDPGEWSGCECVLVWTAPPRFNLPVVRVTGVGGSPEVAERDAWNKLQDKVDEVVPSSTEDDNDTAAD